MVEAAENREVRERVGELVEWAFVIAAQGEVGERGRKAERIVEIRINFKVGKRRRERGDGHIELG